MKWSSKAKKSFSSRKAIERPEVQEQAPPSPSMCSVMHATGEALAHTQSRRRHCTALTTDLVATSIPQLIAVWERGALRFLLFAPHAADITAGISIADLADIGRSKGLQKKVKANKDKDQRKSRQKAKATERRPTPPQPQQFARWHIYRIPPARY
jgi:hypothetical protein